MPIKEIILYTIVSVKDLYTHWYTVHLSVGGLFSPATEPLLTVNVWVIGACDIGFMACDVARRRRSARPE